MPRNIHTLSCTRGLHVVRSMWSGTRARSPSGVKPSDAAELRWLVGRSRSKSKRVAEVSLHTAMALDVSIQPELRNQDGASGLRVKRSKVKLVHDSSI